MGILLFLSPVLTEHPRNSLFFTWNTPQLHMPHSPFPPRDQGLSIVPVQLNNLFFHALVASYAPLLPIQMGKINRILTHGDHGWTCIRYAISQITPQGILSQKQMRDTDTWEDLELDLTENSARRQLWPYPQSSPVKLLQTSVLSVTHMKKVGCSAVAKLVTGQLQRIPTTQKGSSSLCQHHFRAAVLQSELYFIQYKKKIHPQILIGEGSWALSSMRLVVVFPVFWMWHHTDNLFLPPLKPSGVSDWVI